MYRRTLNTLPQQQSRGREERWPFFWGTEQEGPSLQRLQYLQRESHCTGWGCCSFTDRVPRASSQHPDLRKSDRKKIPQYQRSQCSICCYLEPLNCLEANTFWTDTLVLNQQKCCILSFHPILSICSGFSGFKKLLILALTQIKSFLSSKAFCLLQRA